MKRTQRIELIAVLAALSCFSILPANPEAQVQIALADIDQYDSQWVEVEGVPLVSTFKEDDGYGVWNLLIGRDENKLLCYEDGANIADLRAAHEDIQAIIEKNEDFKKEGRDLQSVTVRGNYDGESEILNLTEAIYTKGSTQYEVVTDADDEPEQFEGDEEIYEDGRVVEQYIIFHEVGRPWLHAPVWWHYPAWWSGIWIDVHWGWRPWYDCGLGWYIDHYCYDWRYRYRDRCGYNDYDQWGKPYRKYDRRRGLPRDQGVRYYDRQYRSKQNSRRDTYPVKEYRAKRKDDKTDRYRAIKPQQKTFRRADRSMAPGRKLNRSRATYSRPSIRSSPSRSSFRSSPSAPRGSRAYSSPRATPKAGRRR
ncbi:MAG: hypothetical protein JSV84_05060 [Gemmatimonadota bacterium]|nr:MAG: hypothetical protein JSV84_05060 [Gemmatimonadota bacterium]